MSQARNLALSFAGAALFASLPASADTSAPSPTPVVIVQQGAPVPLAPQPAAPAPVQPGYAPGYAPGGYPPGAYPVPYPGGYPAPYYGPGGYYAPRPSGYYAARYAPMPMTERQSVGAVVGGGIAIGAGGILVIAALIAAIPGACTFNNNDQEVCDSHTGTVVGLTVAGLAAIAVGIPLLIYGNKRIPVGAAAAAATSGLPAWAGKPGGTGWSWKF